MPAATEVDAVVRDLVRVQNLRGKTNRLAEAAGQLALHGPMKLPEAQGLQDSTPLLEDYDTTTGNLAPRSQPMHGANYRPDPSERRTGDAPSDELAAVIQRTVDDAKAVAADSNVQRKQKTTAAALEEAINNIRGAVMIVYPMGLPDYDHVRQILEEREDLDGAAALEELDPNHTSLWCFSKELQRDKLLSEYVGKNDKTKVVAKLQKKGAGAPTREAIVSEDEQKAMIAFYHKKEQEQVRVALCPGRLRREPLHCARQACCLSGPRPPLCPLPRPRDLIAVPRAASGADGSRRRGRIHELVVGQP